MEDVTALKKWIETENNGEWLTASELYNQLVKLDSRFGSSYSVQSLGKRLNNVRTELEKLFGMEKKFDRSKKISGYRFPVKSKTPQKPPQKNKGAEGEDEPQEEIHDLTGYIDEKPESPNQETLLNAIKEAVDPAIEKYEREQKPKGTSRSRSQIEFNILSEVLKRFPNANTDRVRFYIKELKKRGEIAW